MRTGYAACWPFCLHAALYLAAAGFGSLLVPASTPDGFFLVEGSFLARGLEHWDAGWYVRIARQGYDAESIVFFPLYPAVLRLAGIIVPHASQYIVGAAFSALCFLAALYLLQRLMALDGHPEPLTERTLLYLALFPTAFYFNLVYTEALFLALTLGALYAARRGRWAAAGVLGALATLTRNVGVALWPALALEYAEAHGLRLRREVLALLLPPLAYGAFMLYQAVAFGDPLAHVHAQLTEGWGRRVSVPGYPLALALEALYPVHFGYGYAYNLNEVAFTLMAVGLLVLGWRRVRRSYWVFAAGALILPLGSFIPSAPLTSLPRYVAVLFPNFITLAALTENRWAERLTAAVFSALFALFTVLYTNGYWVA
ncbi:MAG: hypothetical protein H5T97_03480 [Firmicutes bacterium]|nr:hypothetical protein [Bacillota bacterium]